MKTGVEKKNNGRVKNRKGVQKEEGVKTFVYDKRNRAITCAFSRDLLLAELHARRFAVLGYFWCDFAVTLFFKVRCCGFQSPSMR